MVTVEWKNSCTLTDATLGNSEPTVVSVYNSDYTGTYTLTVTGYINNDSRQDSELYKELVKKEKVRRLKASWYVKRKEKSKLKVSIKPYQDVVIRNTLPKKIRKD